MGQNPAQKLISDHLVSGSLEPGTEIGLRVDQTLHQARFGRPGASLAGSDSHTCAAGAVGMLAISVRGLAGGRIPYAAAQR
jgi:hypothetical protein